jgi:hypothetical protein
MTRKPKTLELPIAQALFDDLATSQRCVGLDKLFEFAELPANLVDPRSVAMALLEALDRHPDSTKLTYQILLEHFHDVALEDIKAAELELGKLN